MINFLSKIRLRPLIKNFQSSSHKQPDLDRIKNNSLVEQLVSQSKNLFAKLTQLKQKHPHLVMKQKFKSDIQQFTKDKKIKLQNLKEHLKAIRQSNVQKSSVQTTANIANDEISEIQSSTSQKQCAISKECNPDLQNKIKQFDTSNNDGLYQIFKYFGGLFNITPKVKLGKEMLSYVYTPGVGKTCLEIQQNPKLVQTLTNRANQILVISDGSGFAQFDTLKWDNVAPIPYLEALTTYYKTQANIDAFPLLIDPTVAKTEEEIIEVLSKLSTAYSGFELFRMERSKMMRLKILLQDMMVKGGFPPTVIFPSDLTKFIEDKFEEMQLNDENYMDPILVKAAIFRAALDTGFIGVVTEEVIQECLSGLFQETKLGNINDNVKNLIKVLETSAKCFLKQQVNNNNQMQEGVEAISKKFLEFKLFGKENMIQYPNEYIISEQHCCDANSVKLHEIYQGVIQSKPSINLHYIDKTIFAEGQLNYIADQLLEQPCLAGEITSKKNLAAIISNGTAILGLGNIGAEAGLPVMEGKSVLFKELGGVNVVPILLQETDPKKFQWLVRAISPIFSAINLEDIKAPDCFEIETGLDKALPIPIFHDDQHGTAIVAAAGVLNALVLTNKHISTLKVVVNGGGSAGTSIVNLLLTLGVKDIIVCDTKGAIYSGRPYNMNPAKEIMALKTNLRGIQGQLSHVIENSDLFIGVSAPKTLTPEMIMSMNQKPIIFALANPDPEIYPDEAKKAGAYIVATGRSDFENQLNNSLVFPGLFRGLLDVQASRVSERMQIELAKALANVIPRDLLSPRFIIPNALDHNVSIQIAKTVAEVANLEGQARRKLTPQMVEENMRHFHLIGKLKY